jgi:hypothetical protein
LALDEPANGKEAAYQSRVVSYEQRIALMSALERMARHEADAMQRMKDELQRMAAEQAEQLETVRRDSIQLLGLLAGVVGLVTSLFASTMGRGSREIIVAGFAAAAAIGGFLLVFTLLQNGSATSTRRMVIATATVILLAAASVIAWRAPV